MLIRNELYFAPDVKFSELDMTGNILPVQFKKRICGYYLNPAKQFANACHGFAAGVLLVSCIDALARIQTGINRVGDRFKQWCQQNLHSLADKKIRLRFYEDFRNGLVHEARIKNGSEFTLESNTTVTIKESIMSINPLYLAKEIEDALNEYIRFLEADIGARKKLIDRIRGEFSYELDN